MLLVCGSHIVGWMHWKYWIKMAMSVCSAMTIQTTIRIPGFIDLATSILSLFQSKLWER